MQVAALEKVYVFDLMALRQHTKLLNHCATSTLRSTNIIKVGVKLPDDLRSVYESYPLLTAFKDVANVVDLR